MTNARNIYVGIVDDDESICRSLGRLLRTAGYQAITYPSAESLLQDLKHPQFECLVLDIQLGGMSGIELKETLAAAGSVIPVIFITAHDEPEMRKQAAAAGCAAYLRKTDSGSEVLDAIRRATTGPTQPTNKVPKP